MKNIIIAKRYAIAATKTLKIDQYQDILNDLKCFKQILIDKPDIKRYISSDIVNQQGKTVVFEMLTENSKNKDFWLSVFKVFTLKKRNNLISLFFEEFEQLLNTGLKQKQVDLYFAHPMDDATLQKIQERIEEILGYKVIYDIHIDKSIIGGFVARSKGQIIDASVKTNLENFAKTII